MALSNRDRVDRAQELLGTALDAFLQRVLQPELPKGADWTAMLAAKDGAKGITGKTYNRVDPYRTWPGLRHRQVFEDGLWSVYDN